MELLFREDAYLQDCAATVTSADETGIRLDRTVFYPMGGGQPGDTGQLVLADGSIIEITDTLKGSGPDDGIKTDALPAVWTRPEQFQQAAARFVDESAHFKSLAQGDDIPALKKGAGDLGAACKNCHDTFREKD